eukprot:m.225787 g.225787  ORF g.225787 m.225787 type:complete len:110 (-) comp13861_c0_seq6:2545-2874(-)
MGFIFKRVDSIGRAVRPISLQVSFSQITENTHGQCQAYAVVLKMMWAISLWCKATGVFLALWCNCSSIFFWVSGTTKVLISLKSSSFKTTVTLSSGCGYRHGPRNPLIT